MLWKVTGKWRGKRWHDEYCGMVFGGALKHSLCIIEICLLRPIYLSLILDLTSER